MAPMIAFSQNETFPRYQPFEDTAMLRLPRWAASSSTRVRLLERWHIFCSLTSDVPRSGGPQQTGTIMRPFFLLVLRQLVTLSLTPVTVVRHPS